MLNLVEFEYEFETSKGLVMHTTNTNVFNIQTGEPLDQDINTRSNESTYPEEEVCDAIKQYRIEKEIEAQRREAGWPEAIGANPL